MAIVGRPNVGKSTLFNRLTGTRRAITDDRPGVTRDRIHANAEWGGHRFTLVDTGGYVLRSGGIEGEVRKQAEMALEEADLVLLVCDAGEGVSGADREVADLLRRRGMRSLLVINKVDHPEPSRYDMGEFFGLGLGDPHPVSGANGRRSGDLLEAIVSGFDDPEAPPPAPDRRGSEIRVVLAGRPNVGKSTLINRLCGERVSIVHEQPGTTRDSTDVTILRDGQRFVLVDTAGVRRRSRVRDPVEYFSALRASHSLESADVVVALLDATEKTTAQDARIMSRVLELGRGLVVAVNKWDLVTGGDDIAAYREGMRRRHPFLRHYPILTLSALTGRRAEACLTASASVAGRARARIPTSRMNRWLREVTRRVAPGGGGQVRILYATQTGVSPPSFVMFSNRPDQLSPSYRRFVENSLRESIDFTGTPVRIHWRSSRSRPSRGGAGEGRDD